LALRKAIITKVGYFEPPPLFRMGHEWHPSLTMTDTFDRLICSHPEVDITSSERVSRIDKNNIAFVLNAFLRLPKYLQGLRQGHAWPYEIRVFQIAPTSPGCRA